MNKKYNKLINKAEALYNKIEKKTDGDTMSLINEYCDLQLKIEELCNK